MRKYLPIFMICVLGWHVHTYAQSRIKPGVLTTKITENFHILQVHNFVNMLVFDGSEGALVVDSGFEPVHLIEEALDELNIDDVKYIINTHFDGDHVEGNDSLGRDALIISSQGCRERLASDTTFPASGLPHLVFSDSLTLYFDQEQIKLYEMPGHTDHDVVVYFMEANIVCIGDFDWTTCPGIWPEKRGSIFDLQRSMDRMVELFPRDALFIPGHGLHLTMTDLELRTAMLDDALHLVNPLIEKGLSRNQIIQQNPLSYSSYPQIRDNAKKWIDNIFNSRELFRTH